MNNVNLLFVGPFDVNTKCSDIPHLTLRVSSIPGYILLDDRTGNRVILTPQEVAEIHQRIKAGLL